MTGSPARLPLHGMRVLEVAHFYSGPYCGCLLADLGADVVKVEPPGSGDVYRTYGPAFLGGESTSFLALNRNKRSAAINLKHAEGQALFRRLAARADVLVENFKPGTMARLGLGYEQLREASPRLIYCAISGYGQTGPYSARGGFDAVLQGEGALMSVTGEPEGEPCKVGVPVLDIGTGMFAAYAILAAYIGRQRGPEAVAGRLIDVSLYDTALAWFAIPAMNYLATGEVPRAMGSASYQNAPYQGYRTQDGYLMVGTGNERLWAEMCRIMGLPHLVDDPRFKTNADRVRNQAALNDQLQPVLLTRPRKMWQQAFEAAGIPCGPINDLDQVLADPHTAARDLWVDMDHPSAGRLKTVGVPIKISGIPRTIRRPPPSLGEHTAEVLGELGLSEAALQSLHAAGAIALASGQAAGGR